MMGGAATFCRVARHLPTAVNLFRSVQVRSAAARVRVRVRVQRTKSKLLSVQQHKHRAPEAVERKGTEG